MEARVIIRKTKKQPENNKSLKANSWAGLHPAFLLAFKQDQKNRRGRKNEYQLN